jgi:hypothetical protein
MKHALTIKPFLQRGQIKAALFPSQSSSRRIEFRSIVLTGTAITLRFSPKLRLEGNDLRIRVEIHRASIAYKEKCRHKAVAFLQQTPQMFHGGANGSQFRTRIRVDSINRGTLPYIRSSFNVATAINGVSHEKRHRD